MKKKGKGERANDRNKEREGREVSRREESVRSRIWNNDILYISFHFIVVLWAPPSCSLFSRVFIGLSDGVIIILQFFVFLQFPTMTCGVSYFLFHIVFVILLSFFLWLYCNFLHCCLAWQGLRFKVSSHMLFLFVYIFCKCKWKHCSYFTTPSIVASVMGSHLGQWHRPHQLRQSNPTKKKKK